MGRRLSLGVWRNITTKIPISIALERVESIFPRVWELEARFLYVVVVDLPLTTSIHINSQQGCFCKKHHAVLPSYYSVPSHLPLGLVYFKPSCMCLCLSMLGHAQQCEFVPSQERHQPQCYAMSPSSTLRSSDFTKQEFMTAQNPDVGSR